MTETISGNAASVRIAALRQLMKERGISACIVPTADPHMSEYISDHYRSREYITGFTGSAGTAVITASDAGLWTDSRYWLQAAEELNGSGVLLFKDGEPGAPSIEDWLCRQLDAESAAGDQDGRSALDENGCSAGDQDGRSALDENGCSDGGRNSRIVSMPGDAISISRANALRDHLRACGIRLETGFDPVNELRTGRGERPALQFHEIAEHPIRYAGLSRTEKIELLRGDLKELCRNTVLSASSTSGANSTAGGALVLSSLDDIAWLLNLRGCDIPCSPVFFAFVILTTDEVRLYASLPQIPAQLQQRLVSDGIGLCPYDAFYEDLSRLENAAVLLDPDRSSDRIRQSLPDTARIIHAPGPVMLRKCVKNPVEMDGIRAAHIRDGAALCKFLYWLKQQISCLDRAARRAGGLPQPLTERSAAEKLHAFRAQQDLFAGDSFDPIMAYGPHGAIVHYSATEESDVPLQPRGLLLIDSGGQYADGTTDVTRTVVLGPLTSEEKRCFTAVLRGHINLARAVFPEGITGAQLDILARQPLWQQDLDYGHGTGHGVGAYLNVHEDPLRIHWAAGRKPAQPAFAEGMLVSNEPGFYQEGQFGIRHENLILCVPAGNPSDESSRRTGNPFLQFETVTLVPFDLEGIDPKQMQPGEIAWLNAYHQTVREKIAPHLDDEERAWLREATRPI